MSGISGLLLRCGQRTLLIIYSKFQMFIFFVVQELYVRRGLTPKYDLVQIEGAVHEPTFKYRGEMRSRKHFSKNIREVSIRNSKQYLQKIPSHTLF